MKPLRKYIAYSLSLSMILFASNAFTKDSIVQNDHKIENNKTINKPSVFSAYYNAHFRNNSKTAKVTITRTGFQCMYNAGPSDDINLAPQQEINFSLEDNNNFLAHCHSWDKWVTWSIMYNQSKYCDVELRTAYIDMMTGWRTYFAPVNVDIDCQIPIKFICDGSESKCQNGYVSRDGTQISMEIND
ncbi:hypothetical protein [Xenorhabdus cabanillasii]|uniref:Uncharacterized protein n=2 Tax=Xenorhabdus cabanillasii TaxID=351673 RepID=A0A3D9UFD0_9GAMM|nr:hypothetical protein [Xenorhabdus cabanillasii]PHM77058.1 hypothetical protein Xcab_02356 [Xenorhabdus cabanillasii JM26]REF26620.1 hypothetical protein BDD26_1290 [Xenorhabdus cabanillasii]CDL86157.1 exported hypothetical protein [Xenorhabdus cabanillasii JM26]